MSRSFGKKSGFTLIELLAVIVILAVIALIATPLVLNIIERAEKGAFKDSVYGIMEAAEFQVILDESKYPITFVYPLDSDRIKFKGTKPSEGYLQIVSEGKMKLALGNGRWCAVKDVNDSQVTITNGKCEKIEFNRPIISGYGDLNQTIPVNGSYTMPNVTATDKDGNKLNITTTIKQGDNTVDKIDTSKEGTFTIIYTTESDKDGNTATIMVTVTVQKPKSAATTLIENATEDSGLELIDNTYYYRGSNPKNYIQFDRVTGNNSVWRIISIEGGRLKIINPYNYASMAWGRTYPVQDWKDSNINTHLNETEVNNLPTILRNKIDIAPFYTGKITFDVNLNTAQVKAEERMQTWNGKLGLLNASDYFYASKDSDCLTKPLTNWNCKNDNWIPYNYAGGVWTINPSSQSTDSMGYIYYMQHVGCIDHQQGHVTAVYLMVTHLKEDIQIISGDGSQETPYIIAA